jgi:2-polyprenyl-3-methyl-5-hydroxy-6-metoxy-1,4-benzoquinol methylase
MYREQDFKSKNPPHYQFEDVHCYQCGSEKSRFFLIGEEDLTGKEGLFRYVQCDDCGLVYQSPRVTMEQIGQFYDQEYIAHRKKTDWGILTPLYEWAMNKHDRDKDKIVSKYLKLDQGKKVIDIGCAVGTFLLHLNKKYQAQISGVDFSKNLNYPGFEKINFFQGLFYEQKIPEQSYDMVTMWHFLEHCYDPKQSLNQAYKILKDDGIMVIEVPRLDSLTFKLFGNKWPGVQAPQHTVLFDKKHFVKMVEDQGFEIIEYLPYGAFPSYFYIFAGAYFKLLGKGLNLNKIIFPYFAGQLLLSPILLFEKYLNLSMQTIVCKRK